MSAPVPFEALAQRFDCPGARAIVLVGSYARGQAGPLSDVDLVRFTDEPAPQFPGTGSHLIDGRLVVVREATPELVTGWFQQPEAAVGAIAGLRSARALIDRGGHFATIQERARAFVWDAAMQARADAWASRQMVGWIEEVHKGLEGLRRGDIGRLLNARFGCSWGLSRLVQVQRGVLLSGDNTFYDEVAEAVGRDSEWARLRRAAFGIEDAAGVAPPLRDQVTAGLRLYQVTAELLASALQPGDRALVEQTVALIAARLGPR
jgi:hypothetical protein